jgi:hypothetical protein
MFNGQRPTAKGTGITAYFDNGQMVPGFQEAGEINFSDISKQFPNLFQEREVPPAPPSDYDTVYNKISGVLSKGLAPERSFEELVAQRQKIFGMEDPESARNYALMQLGGKIASTPGGLGVALGAGLPEYASAMQKSEAEQRAAQRAIGGSALDALEKQQAERRGVISKAAEFAFTTSENATKAAREAILESNKEVRQAQSKLITESLKVTADQLAAKTKFERDQVLDKIRTGNDLWKDRQIKGIEAKGKADTYATPNGKKFLGYVDTDTGKIINSETGEFAAEGAMKYEKPSGGTSADTYTTPDGKKITATMMDGKLIDVDTGKPAPVGSLKFDSGAKVNFQQQDITIFDKKFPNGFAVVSGAFGTDGLYYVNGKVLDPRVTEFVPGSDVAQVKILEDGSAYIYYNKGPNAGTTTPIQLSSIDPETGKTEKIELNTPGWVPSNDNAFSIRMEKPPVPAAKLGTAVTRVLQTDLRQLNTVINGIDLLIPKVAGLTGPLAKAKSWSTTAAAFIPFENLAQLATYLESEKGAKEWQLLGREYVAARLLSDKSATSEQAAIYEREWIGLPKQFAKNPQAALAQLQQIRVTLANRGSEIVGTLTDSPYNIIDTIPMGNEEQPFNMGDERTYNYVSDLESKGIKGSYQAFYPEKGVPDNIKATVKITNGAYGLGYYPTITFK